MKAGDNQLLSVFRDVDQVTICFAAGGDAYVSKMRMGTDLIYATTEVLAGGTFVSPQAGYQHVLPKKLSGGLQVSGTPYIRT